MAKQSKTKQPATTGTPKFTLGKPYHVRPATAYDNAASWALIQKALATGPQTQAQLLELVAPRNHKTFVGYAIRRGWLAVA
jgi:hypothetical protein